MNTKEKIVQQITGRTDNSNVEFSLSELYSAMEKYAEHLKPLLELPLEMFAHYSSTSKEQKEKWVAIIEKARYPL